MSYCSRDLSFLRASLSALASLLVASSTPLATAENRPIDSLPPESRAEINDSLGNILNALNVFASADSVSSGSYRFDEEGGPDTDLDVAKVGLDLSLVEDEKEAVVPFLSALVGHAKVTGQQPPLDGIGDNDFVRFDTTSFGLGGGVDLDVGGDFHVVPRMMFVYAESENDYDYNNPSSRKVGDQFDGDLFNWDVETMTYLPSIEVYYTATIGDVKIRPSVQYTHVDIHSFWTNSALLDVSSQSEIILTRLSGTVPLGTKIADTSLELELFGARRDLYGDVQDGVGFHSYHEIGTILHGVSDNDLWIFKDVGIGGSYAFCDEMTGWRVALQGQF